MTDEIPCISELRRTYGDHCSMKRREITYPMSLQPSGSDSEAPRVVYSVLTILRNENTLVLVPLIKNVATSSLCSTEKRFHEFFLR